MRRVGFFLALLLALPGAWAGGRPVIAIIIDDVGDRLEAGRRTVDLPGPVAGAFLPHTPYSVELAERAHGNGKEVMLHLPMQAVGGAPPGPGAVTLHMDRMAFERTVAANLAALPHVVGVNNHMGSLITRHPGHMAWLMRLLRERQLFFVDSRTSVHTVAEQLAHERGVPVVRRHVFLDHDPSVAAIRGEFQRLVQLAHAQGYALAIGHPYSTTLEVLEAELPRLQEYGVELIPVSELIARDKENRRWLASSSPSPTAAKSSKPSP